MVRLGNRAVVGQQMAIERRGINLPADRALRECADQTDDANRAPLRWLTTANYRGSEQVFGFEQAAQGKRRRRLRAVEQRQPSFAARVIGSSPA